MATMIAELYDALKAAGAPDDHARKAAEVVAGYENQFAELREQMPALKGNVTLIQWMLGFNLAATVGIMMILLRH
jgi:hypothetical protein